MYFSTDLLLPPSTKFLHYVASVCVFESVEDRLYRNQTQDLLVQVDFPSTSEFGPHKRASLPLSLPYDTDYTDILRCLCLVVYHEKRKLGLVRIHPEDVPHSLDQTPQSCEVPEEEQYKEVKLIFNQADASDSVDLNPATCEISARPGRVLKCRSTLKQPSQRSTFIRAKQVVLTNNQSLTKVTEENQRQSFINEMREKELLQVLGQ